MACLADFMYQTEVLLLSVFVNFILRKLRISMGEILFFENL
jgi:hypothetical protein